MKKFIISTLLLIPILMYSQNKPSSVGGDLSVAELKAIGSKKALNQDSLSSALKYYLAAFTIVKNRKGKEDMGKLIQKIFKDLENQREREKDAKEKAERILGYFFDEGAGTNNKDSIAAWIQGANGKYAVMNLEGHLPAKLRGEEAHIWEEPQRFEKKRSIARRGGLYYFVNNLGKPISEGFDFIHDTNLPQSFGIQKTVNKNPLELALNIKTGETLNNIRLLKEGALQASDTLFPYESKGKWSLINAYGKSPNSSRYDYVGSLYGGYAKVNSGGKRNDTTGAVIGGKWGFIDEQGVLRVDTVYEEIGEIIDRVVWVKSARGYMLLSQDTVDGSLKIYKDSMRIEATGQMEKDTIRNGKLNKVYKKYFSDKIDDSGILKDEFFNNEGKSSNNERRTTNGLIRFTKRGKSYVIEKFRLNDLVGYKDENGYEIFPAKYDEIVQKRDTNSNKLVFQTKQRALYGLEILSTNNANEEISGSSKNSIIIQRFRSLACDYEEIGKYRHKQNYVRVKQNGKWGYVFWDTLKDGSEKKRFIKCQYDVATDFYQNKPGDKGLVARVYIKEFSLYFYINTKGEMLAQLERDSPFR